ncbi:Inwardly rectifying K channel [Nesidiocoris tenuis]|uniref:Inwardly rectifying K channel n=1 Tax=Nesidiocoris tenuis TaxID=355587 RepID=A0ABN7BI28_9HEMI|nr:Inwardly rectifying K channel [Nesidiocoris tenuis]
MDCRIDLGEGSGENSNIGQQVVGHGLPRRQTNVGQLLEYIHRYRQTRFSSRRVRRRVVFKHGDCNVVQGKVAKRRRKYLQDIFTTLVDAQWRWTLLVFSMNFLLSWLGFAVLWWLVLYSHGDLDPVAQANLTRVPCVKDVTTFSSCFLFSVETQHTIGYGAKHTTDECPEAIFVMCLQSLVGVMIQAFMVGIVFAKLSRPKKRTQTLLFSRNAVINQRDGQLCLMFRVGDMRKSHIIEAHVRAQLITKKVTKEGEVLPFHQYELKVGGDGEEDKIFFIWPTTIVHKINPDSPLYNLSAADMMRHRFEIVVILEGVIESTGMTTQARSSYLPNEILWGHRFETMVNFKKETGEHEVDYSQFNSTYEVDTPICSAQTLDQLMGLSTNNNNNGSKFLIGSSLASETPDLTSMDSTSIMCEKSIESQHQQHQQFNNNIVNGCCPTVVPQLNSHMVNIGGGNGQTVELPNGPESHI